MKSAFKKMRGRSSGGQHSFRLGPVRPTHEEVSPVHLAGRNDVQEKPSVGFSMRASMDARKRSGSFGSRMLRRAKSAVGRQSRKVNEEYDEKPDNGLSLVEKIHQASPRLRRALFHKQMSLNENILHQTNRRPISSPNEYSVMRPSTNNGIFNEENGPAFFEAVEAKPFPAIMMQGDLYRRKRLTWSRTWAVLTADRVLTLYKTKEDLELHRKEWNRHEKPITRAHATMQKTSTLGGFANTLSPGILAVINLNAGCEIENVVQGKKSTTFQLIPHFYQAISQGGASTLPFEPGSAALSKSVHLMCKNNDEFLYWVKAFVQLNTNDRPAREETFTSPLNNLALDVESPARERPVLHRQKHHLNHTEGLTRDAFYASVTTSTPENSPKDSTVKDQIMNEDTDVRQSTPSPLDQLKFIDEDDDFEESGFRVYSDVEDNINEKESLSPRTIFRITDNGKERLPAKKGSPVTDQHGHRQQRKFRECERENTTNDETLETEFKKCSTTEKVDMRTAQIVAGGKSPLVGNRYDMTPVAKAEKDKHRRKDGKGKKPTEDKKIPKTGESFINPVDSKTADASAHIESRYPRRQGTGEIISSKTNKQSRTREKQTREKGAGKNRVIADDSHCDEQTMQSLQSDKRGGISSLDTPVYSDRKLANENIRSGVGSVKDKQSDLVNSSSIIQCEDPKIRDNSKDLQKSESKGRELNDERNKSTETADSETVALQKPSEVDSKITSNSVSSSPEIYKHNSIRRLKSRSKAYSNIRKQKSLRQKVLRKLGPKASLSNSSPDLNSAIEKEEAARLEIPSIELSLVSSSAVNLRRNSAFRRDSSPLAGARSLSEGDLLEAVEEEDGRNMRTFKNVRKISQDNFLETYGVLPRKKNGKRLDHTKRHTTYDDSTKDDLPGFTLYADEFQDDLSHNGGKARRGSISDSSSSDSSYQASLTNSDPQTREVLESTRKASLDKCHSHGDLQSMLSRNPKSTCSDDSGSRNSSKEEPRNSWLSSLTPHFARKASKSAATNTSSKNNQTSRRAVFHIPASQLTAAAHRGYLDRRNKKRQWERFWCVLQDSCLYCYNSPQSDNTVDAVVLRGYDVIADVTNMNRTRFSVRLERNGSPTYHFSSENHQQFLLWVGTLEKETSNVLPATSDNEVLVNSVKSTTNTHRHDNEVGVFRPETVDNVPDHETFETQKENLLREVLAQQQKLIEEQRRLQEHNTSSDIATMPDYTTKRLSKNLVNERYSRAKDDEELKIMKSLTHLNRRRNSAQLKVDQITKQLAPKSGRKRRENPQQFAEMEDKLRQLQERLAIVDKEIQGKHAMRQDVIEKIQQRRDLELLLLEQQENLAIIRNHQARQKRAAFAEQTQPQVSNERLASIDEMSSISDCSSTSSNSLPDPVVLDIDTRLQAMSTPRQSRVTGMNANGTISDGDSCFHRSSDMEEVMSQSNSSIEGGLSDDFRSISTSSEEERMPRRTVSSNSAISMASVSSLEEQPFKKADQVHPSILADIEDFQRFSKQKLAKLGSNE